MIPHAYFEKVKAYFDGDTTKTWAWFKAPNSQLKHRSPLWMLSVGKGAKLQKFIDTVLAEQGRL